MKIQKKALQHVLENIKSCYSYCAYSALSAAIRKKNIDNEVISDITRKYQEAMAEQNKKLNAAKEWVNSLISDFKNE